MIYRLANLIGNVEWPFTIRIDGADLVVDNILVTCFGGAFDPQDDGQTASGISTKDPTVDAVSLPMRDDEDAALAGSPLPRMPFGTIVTVIIDGIVYAPPRGVIDLGPGKQATKGVGLAHALDLTVAAAARFAPGVPLWQLASSFAKRGAYRIVGGAKYLQ